MKQKRGTKALRKRCWDYISLYVRYRDKGICISCGIKKDPAGKWELNGGHYLHNCLDFDEQNINCQCINCNFNLQGNQYRYGLALIRKYGEGIIEELERRKAQEKKYTYQELEEIEKKYKSKYEKAKKNYQ